MSVKDGKFQTEYKIAQIGKALRGSTLLSRPQLCVSRETERFFLRFPREILAHCSDSEYPKWYVQTEDKCKVFTVDFLEGRIGRYTEECEKAFPTELLFQKIKLTLLSDERTYQTYRIPASDLRFFNERGVGTDWRSGTVSPGNWIVYSTSKEVPQVLYREPTVPSVFDGNIYRCIYDLRDGDIVKFPNGFAVAVGRSISEGLNGKPLKGVRVGRNNERIDLFTDFPQIIVKADRAQLSGGFLKIRGEQCTERFLRLSETACEELRLDVSSEDIEAYAVDLSQYISDSDIYELEVNLPNSKTNRFYRFAYLKDFSFEFIDAPYLFCEAGVIRFPSSTPIEAKSEWEISLTGKSLPFSFDPDSDYGKDVEGTQLILQYRLKDRAIRLCFDIPAFFWKYEKDGEWNYQRPADITIKRLPQYLYVCGPFDFGSKVTKLNVDKVSFDDFESTDIYAEKVAGEECYRFHLANAKSWMDRSSVKRMIYVTLGGKTYDLIKVQCRSDCISASIYADHDAGALHGKLEIIGDSEYSVKVERNGEKLGDDIPLINGEFLLETDKLGGEYLITVYEMIEDDSGFDYDTYKLGEYKLSLVDMEEMEGRIITLRFFRDYEKRFLPRKLKESYFVQIEKLECEPDLDSIIGSWSLDFGDEKTLKKCTFYRGTLMHVEGRQSQKDFDVLVIFYSKHEIDKFVILRLFEAEYVELLYDRKTETLLYDDSNLNRRQKFERVLVLEDDKYECVSEFSAKT